MTKLSKNFSVEELTKTSHPVNNTPNAEQLDALRDLCENVLQPIRDEFGPVKVNSGFRSADVNRLVGGSATSDHCKGMAADIEVQSVSNLELAAWIRNNLEFKQLILEFHNPSDPSSGWVHVSYDRGNLKGEVLRAVKDGGKTRYLSGLV